MPCHVRSASSPRKRRRPSVTLSPPRIVALLDMGKETERHTQAFLQRACSGRWPRWRVFGMKRHGNILALAVEWLRCGDPVYSLVELALDKPAMSWRDFPTLDAVRQALEAFTIGCTTAAVSRKPQRSRPCPRS